MYELKFEFMVESDLESVWGVWSDMADYPTWDPREQVLRLDGPFAPGTSGFSKQTGPRPGSEFRIVRVEPMTRFTNESPLPGGKLVIDHELRAQSTGSVRLVKRYEVHGPMALAFRLFFARGIRAEMPSTFHALNAEIARRRAAV